MVVLLVVVVETAMSRNRATEGPERQRSSRVKGRKKTIFLQQRKKAGEETAAESHICCGDLAATLQQPSSDRTTERRRRQQGQQGNTTGRRLTPFNGCLFGGLAGRRRQQMGTKDEHRRHRLTGNWFATSTRRFVLVQLWFLLLAALFRKRDKTKKLKFFDRSIELNFGQ